MSKSPRSSSGLAPREYNLLRRIHNGEFSAKVALVFTNTTTLDVLRDLESRGLVWTTPTGNQWGLTPQGSASMKDTMRELFAGKLTD